MLEYEMKKIITKHDYKAIVSKIKNRKKPVIQKNFYYDDDSFFMNKNRITCRIRENKGHYEATIKAHQAPSSYCSVENSFPVNGPFDDDFFKNMGLKRYGTLITERYILLKTDEISVNIDKNNYLGKEDYEVEVEFKNGYIVLAKEIMQSLLPILFSDGMNDNNELSFETKSERFFIHYVKGSRRSNMTC